ncbi:hypothetical protein ACFTY8_40905 [Streptomyces mirabilis]|uniref:hypothetical protein n=1 Tax=Streptomyces mirabilis TaxID=68239 RepID=UPI0036304F06
MPSARAMHAMHPTLHAFLAVCLSKRSVARQLGMTLNTVLRLSRATEAKETCLRGVPG